MKYKNMTEQELLQELKNNERKWNIIKTRLLIAIAVCLIMFSGLSATYLITNYEREYTFTVKYEETDTPIE